MKKSILAVAVVLGSTAFAQKMESKHGEAYLPAAEDWAISIDANPFLNYFGNIIAGVINDSTNMASWNSLTTNQTIYGKYFAADDMAYRAGIRIGFGSKSGSEMVRDRGVDPLLVEYPTVEPTMVENTWKTGYTNIAIMVGLEKRRGFGRLQGFYGAELGLSFASMKNTFTYGNAYNSNATFNVSADPDDDMSVAMYDGQTMTNAGTDPFGNAARITEYKSGMEVGIGLRGFIGAEYFIMPRLALGGEFGWGLGVVMGGTESTTMENEGLNSGGTEVQSTFTAENKNDGSFGLDTETMNSVFGPAGRLKLTFHF